MTDAGVTIDVWSVEDALSILSALEKVKKEIDMAFKVSIAGKEREDNEKRKVSP